MSPREMLDIKAGIDRPKIDVHCHVWRMSPEEERLSSDHLVTSGRKLGIKEMWISSPITGGRRASMDEVRAQNNAILRAMQRHPDALRGMCFVIPGNERDVTSEIERCLDAGMVGIKLYNQYKITDPAVAPILKLAAERRVPVLEHAAYLPAPEHRAEQPLTSHGADFARASEAHPDTTMIHAHIGGGGDWEWTIRALRDASPNVLVDVSGSNLDDGQVEFAVWELGADRVIFGTDGTMAGSVGKVLDAELTERERELIFWTNAERLLAAQGKRPLHPRRLEGPEGVTVDAL